MTSIDQWEESFERAPWWTTMKAAVGGTVIVLVIAAIVGLATTGSVFFQGEAAKKTIGARVNKQVYTPDNAIGQIAFFHDTCRRITDADTATVRNAAARLAGDEQAATYARDPIRQQQAADALTGDQTDLTGAENVLAKDVADYNSRSAQSTANVFKGRGLPHRFTAPAFSGSPDAVERQVADLANVDCG